jgi:hypothetical protein
MLPSLPHSLSQAPTEHLMTWASPESQVSVRKGSSSHITAHKTQATDLLLLPQSKETDTGNLYNLEPDTRNITLCLALATETSDEDLVVLVDKIEATVVGNESSDLFGNVRRTRVSLHGHEFRRKRGTFLPFLMSWTRIHFRMAELGCFASTPTLQITV